MKQFLDKPCVHISDLSPIKTENRMNAPIQNEQHALAEQVYINEFYINRASKLAHMRIQSWKMAITTPGIAKEYISEVKQYIEQSFFSLVPNSFILSEEGYHSSAAVN